MSIHLCSIYLENKKITPKCTIAMHCNGAFRGPWDLEAPYRNFNIDYVKICSIVSECIINITDTHKHNDYFNLYNSRYTL